MSNTPASAAKSQAAGKVQVEPLLCKSCGLCAEYCPQELMKAADAIPAQERSGSVINAAGHVVYELYDPENRCTGCGICANMCPEGAVVVYRRKPARKPNAAATTQRKEDARE